MDLLKLLCPMLILLAVTDTSSAWSQKTGSRLQLAGNTLPSVTEVKSHKASGSDSTTQLEASESKADARYTGRPGGKPVLEEDKLDDVLQEEVKDHEESKVRARYAGHLDDKYILEEDDEDGGKDGKEYQESEEHEGQQENDHLQGYHNVGKKVEDATTKDYHDKGGYSEFKEGGATFDKHHRDHVAENKENENVREHDAGEKFGSEALKEHKLGKHREKSVGHKKHGFKNVYHKEEYGDHKTFHDEFLDNDHHHEYDDQHENRQVQGGKFAKGYKREGENKEFGEGDEAHAWGKEGHDGFREGAYEKGGHLTGHHLGHKKDEGHHEVNGHRSKNAGRRFKKGEAPIHGSDRPQYYAKSNPSPHENGVPYDGHSIEPAHYPYQDGGHHPEQDEERTPLKKDHRFPLKHSKQRHVLPELPHADGRLPAAEPPKAHPPMKHHVQYGAPRTHQEPLVHHRQHPAPNRDVWSSHFSEREPYRHQNHHHPAHLRPQVQHRNIPVSHLRSSPYPWWRHSTSARHPQEPTNLPLTPEGPRFSQPVAQDESQAPSYSHMAHARAPGYFPRY